MRLLLVDDQAMFREGLRLILSQQPDFTVAGEAGDGSAAIAAVPHAKPDVILMDLRMPGLGGVEATRRIKQQWPAIKVIVLTTFDDDQEIFAGVRAGASGYLLKDSSSEKLCEAIRLAHKGETWLQPSVAAKLVAEFNRLSANTAGAAGAILAEPLSAREREVLRCLADGLSNKEIGSRLSIAEGTVKNHMSAVLGKLQVLDRTQAALRGRELGLL